MGRREKRYEPAGESHVPNLDAMSENELMTFWKHYHRPRREDARVLVGGGPNYTNWAAKLANYASNKAAAMGCRKRGDIRAAQIYEDVCDRIYEELPERLRW